MSLWRLSGRVEQLLLSAKIDAADCENDRLGYRLMDDRIPIMEGVIVAATQPSGKMASIKADGLLSA